jgi:hypothetical protein
MFEKIKERLKAKFPGVNLSSKRLDGIAARLEKIVTAEDGIDTALDSMNSFSPFEEIAREDDRVRGLEARIPQPAPAPPVVPPAPAPPAAPTDAPAWAKGLIESNQALAAKLAAFESQGQRKSFETQANEALKAKKIPDSFLKVALKSMNATTPEELASFISEVETDFTDFEKENNFTRFDQAEKPGFSNVKPETIKTDIESWAASKSPQTKEN